MVSASAAAGNATLALVREEKVYRRECFGLGGLSGQLCHVINFVYTPMRL